MNSSRLLLAVATLALTLVFTFAVPTATSAASAKPETVDRRIVIKSVNVAACTIEIEYMRSQTTHTYKIDDITSIKVNDKTAKITDVKPGMIVSDSIERDDLVLDSIILTGSGGPAVAAPKKKQK